MQNFKKRSRTLGLGIIAGIAPAASATVPNYPMTAIGPKPDPSKPNIVVIDSGGTLTSHARDRISYLHYSGREAGTVPVVKILQDLYPELAAVANLSVVTMEG